jgi:UDP-galactopyranose mutase
MKKILVVGAGFSGAAIARELANSGYWVDIIDKRNHIGGNAYDYTNQHGIRIHKYGPHIFHTNNKKAFDWITQFGNWEPYYHKVKAQLSDGQYVTLPVNQETKEIVGEDNIIDIFFRPYTKKMWGFELEELDPNIIKRVPVRNDGNELYFPKDKYQVMPIKGYTSIFEEILSHRNIKVFLDTEFTKDIENDYCHIFNSMSIDEYYNYIHGKLPYRSIKFHHVDLPVAKIIPTSVINFTHTGPYTRLTEWKNFPCHGYNEKYTSITYEEPCDYSENNYERYYPVKDIHGESRELFEKYKYIHNEKTTFIGRCGLYVYIDMHQAISSSLSIAQKFKEII